MKERKVVEIEERIPKLKERRKQRTNRRLILYVSVFFTLMLLIIYFQSSFSQVQQVEVQGNAYASSDWIIEESQLLNEVSMWNIGESEVIERVSQHQAIDGVDVSRQWMNTIVLDINEYERIAYFHNGDSYFPVLETGEIYSEDGTEGITPYDAPILRDFEDEDIRTRMVTQLGQTPSEIRQRMSDIFLDPVENDSSRLTILMNDGFIVSSTVSNFADRISSYPSVVEQLDPDEAGIVHMRMNPYFESFEINEEEDDLESEG
ncbi:cell division protein FtsQ [Salipaludibacillus keqinensis]|uniref:Cell division protein DivIB n=1 Tax=Salipaludibacillus keqinensis TaxID=2045207 RepID=A0A323TI67_9BACI|nr:FtsQ-type POTRA domain-containing protein [Salipaludibacillus keqinensis]PYZ93237.1 cell division protein FtsQ [Salipaludibacillus keqinensis]